MGPSLAQTADYHSVNISQHQYIELHRLLSSFSGFWRKGDLVSGGLVGQPVHIGPREPV